MTAKQHKPPDIPRSGEDWFEGVSRPLWQRHLLPLAPFKSYLEIGVFAADSLTWAAEHLLAEDGQAIGVDLWQPARNWSAQVAWMAEAKETAVRRVSDFNSSERRGRKRVMLAQEDSKKFLAAELSNADEFDLCYIDGCHYAPGALTDFVLAWWKLRPGGVMVADDIGLFRGKRAGPGCLSGEAWCAFVTCFGHLFSVLYDSKDQAAIIKLPDVKKTK